VNQPGIELREVVKRHGSTVAVDHLSFSVRRGEFFSILGPSGSGKTTTLRLIAGFEHPDQGDILIDGQSVRDVPPNLRPVNMVFQHYALFPHLTVSGNVAFGLEMRGVARAEIRSRVGEALEMVHLAAHGDRLPAQLSGGEQQRVALARAFAIGPRLLLADEPTGNLDRETGRQIIDLMLDLGARRGATLVLVTHDPDLALRADRIVHLADGRIAERAPAGALWTRSAE